ncbi:MAG: LytR/AlgR family response regulator transcription factor [Saprospiraceae bacterium]
MSESLKFLIIEDDISTSIDMEMYLSEMGYDNVAKTDNSGSALEIIFSEPPEIILMDIDIKGSLKGTEIAQKIKHLDIPVIFTTGHDDVEYYKEAQKSNMYGYLIKPVSKFSLQSSIEMALKANFGDTDVKEESGDFNMGDAIFLKKKTAYHKISFKDIEFLESEGRYTLVHSKGERFISKYSISDFEKIMKSYNTFRTHRSFLINVDYLVSYDMIDNTISMESGKEIPLSRTKKMEFLECMKMG